ncbi:MAG: STAS domain-containing protein, partial [Candidatus Omnitrophica bacterium]|nr:STAS domain-containing protein [Candidatus Omnitrophota bacterium]
GYSLLDRAIKRGRVEIEDDPRPFGMKRVRLLRILERKGFVYSHQYISDDAQIWIKSRTSWLKTKALIYNSVIAPDEASNIVAIKQRNNVNGNSFVKGIALFIAVSIAFLNDTVQAAGVSSQNVVEAPKEGMFDHLGVWIIVAAVIGGLLALVHRRWFAKETMFLGITRTETKLVIEVSEEIVDEELRLIIKASGEMDQTTGQEFSEIIQKAIRKSADYDVVIVDLSLLNSFNSVGAVCLVLLIKEFKEKLRIVGLENTKVRDILELNKLKIDLVSNDSHINVKEQEVRLSTVTGTVQKAEAETIGFEGEDKENRLKDLKKRLRKAENRKRRLFLKAEVPSSLDANRRFWLAFYDRMIAFFDSEIRMLTGWEDEVNINDDMDAFEQEQLDLNANKTSMPKRDSGFVSVETLLGISGAGIISIGGLKIVGVILAAGALGILLVWAYRKWFAQKVSAHNDVKRHNRQTYLKVIEEIQKWHSDNSVRTTDAQYIIDLEKFARRMINENKLYDLPIIFRLIISLNLFDSKRFETVHYGIIAIWKALISKDNPSKLDPRSSVSFITPQAYHVLSSKLSVYETSSSMQENRLIRFAVNVVLFDFVNKGEQRLAELMWLREEMEKELKTPGTSKLQQITILQDLHGGFRRAAALIGHALGLGVDAYRHIHTLEDLKMSLDAKGISVDNQNIRFVGLNDKYDRGNDPRGIFNLVKWLRDTGKAKVFSANHDTARALGCLGIQYIKGINMEAKHGVGYFAKDAIEHAGWTTIEFDRINEHYLNSEINRVNIVLRQYGLPELELVDITSYRISIEPEMKRIKKINAKIRHENEMGKDNKDYTRQIEQILPDIFTQTLGFIREKREEYNGRITAINDENGIDIELISFVEVTLDNYMENPEVKERTLWELQNFRLFYIDILGNLHIHALPPIDFTTRTVNVHYKGFHGLEAFEMIQEEIRSYFEGMNTLPNSESFRDRMWRELGEAFTIVMEWFSDVDAHIKPVSVIKFMEHGGPQGFNEGLIGARARQFSNRQASFMMIVGHNERKKFNDPETPLPWIVLSPETGSGLMNIDYELAEGYSDRGAYVSFFKRDESGKITGLRQWGFPEADKAKGQVQQDVVAITDITLTDTEGLSEDQLEFLKYLSDGETFMFWYRHKALVEMYELLEILIERAQKKGRQEKERNFIALSKYVEAQIQRELMRPRRRSKIFYPLAVPVRIAKRTKTKNMNVQFVREGNNYVLVNNRKGQQKALVDRLNELATSISRRGSPGLASKLEKLLESTRFVVTTKKRYLKDENSDAVMVASCNINENVVYFHPHFFSLPQATQTRIIYHEIISHILKGIFNEKEAMRDTLAWFENGEKVQHQRFGFTQGRWQQLEMALSKISGFRYKGFDYDRLWIKTRALLFYDGEGDELIRKSVFEYILRMAKFVQQGPRHSGSVLGLAGEISGLYEIVIKRNTTMKEIRLGTLESVNEVVDDGVGGVKEFDAISSNTVFEFKFHLSLNKLYQQVIGVDSIRLPHLKVLTDNPKLQHIRNIVYFGEADNGKVMKAVQLFIENRPELYSRIFVTETNGVSVRLTLEETREFLLDPNTIALLRQEERGHNGRFIPEDFETNNEVMMSLIDKKLEQLAGAKFDVIISVSNVQPSRVAKIKKIVGTISSSDRSAQKQWFARQEIIEEEEHFDAVGRGRDFTREQSSVKRDEKLRKNKKSGGFALTEVLAGVSAVGLISVGGMKVLVAIVAAGALGILLLWAFRRWLNLRNVFKAALPVVLCAIVAALSNDKQTSLVGVAIASTVFVSVFTLAYLPIVFVARKVQVPVVKAAFPYLFAEDNVLVEKMFNAKEELFTKYRWVRRISQTLINLLPILSMGAFIVVGPFGAQAAIDLSSFAIGGIWLVAFFAAGCLIDIKYMDHRFSKRSLTQNKQANCERSDDEAQGPTLETSGSKVDFGDV